MGSEQTPEQVALLDELNEAPGADRHDYREPERFTALTVRFYRAFRSFGEALAQARNYKGVIQFKPLDSLTWCFCVAFVQESEHLGWMVRAAAEEVRTGRLSDAIRYGLNAAMESVHYDQDERDSAFGGEFYAPRYPKLDSPEGERLHDLDDYLLIYGHCIETHLSNCMQDPLDLPIYKHWMGILAKASPDLYKTWVRNHKSHLGKCQVSLNNPWRMLHFDQSPRADELSPRLYDLIHYLMNTANAHSERVLLGSTLEARITAVENYIELVRAADAFEVCNTLRSLSQKLSHFFSCGHEAVAMFCSEHDFLSLESPYVPIRLLLARLRDLGFPLEPWVLLSITKSENLVEPTEIVKEIAKHHDMKGVDANTFRDFWLLMVAESIRPEEVFWDRLSRDEVVHFYQLAPSPIIVLACSDPAVLDAIFSIDLGL